MPVDFLAFVAQDPQSFPWQRFAPSDALRRHGGPGFDYQFTHGTLLPREDVDFAIYQARRYLKPGTWSNLVIPAADFTCIYGHGNMRSRFTGHKPLSCAEVIAISWLHPWSRLGRRDSIVTTRLDSLAFVKVPGTPAEHLSFWQVPDIRHFSQRDEDRAGQRVRHLWISGDAIPANLPQKH